MTLRLELPEVEANICVPLQRILLFDLLFWCLHCKMWLALDVHVSFQVIEIPRKVKNQTR